MTTTVSALQAGSTVFGVTCQCDARHIGLLKLPFELIRKLIRVQFRVKTGAGRVIRRSTAISPNSRPSFLRVSYSIENCR